MTRIVELLVAINALAGIAAFLGLRHVVRNKVFRRDKERPDEVIEPAKPTSNLALKLLRAKPVEELPTSSDGFTERVYIRFRNGRGRTDVVSGVSEDDAREEAEAYAGTMKRRRDVENAIVLAHDQPDGPPRWRTTG
jgi:hypothetical protein